MRLAALATLSVVSLLVGCTTLPDIESNTCGNAVTEDGEDCDTFVDIPGTSCRPPGSLGECRYDCRLNADNSRAVCPTGFACASDGVCRKPNVNEIYERPTRFSSEVSSWVSAVDFDGDGRFDVISADPVDRFRQARFRIHYFDDDGKSSEARTFPRLTTRPVPRKSSAPGPTDLLFSNNRLGMLPGREDRGWVPAAFSSYTVAGDGISVASVYRDLVGWITPFALVASLERGPGIYVPSADTGNLAWLAELPGSNRDLVGDAMAANVFDGADSPCDELILAFRGERAVRVFDLCEVGSDRRGAPVVWRKEPLQQLIPLPATIERAPLATDFDGDGHLDLMLRAGHRTYVARGDGQRFADVQGLDLQRWVVDPENGSALLEEHWRPDLPLAAGDFSGDGIADFVMSDALYVTRLGATGELTYFPAIENRSAPWSMAHIDDLNGNDLPDVVAATEGEPGVMLFNGTGGPYVVDTSLVTRGPVLSLTTGDFDGDQVNDVAFFEGAASRERGDALNVSFSARDGLPAPARVIAEMKGVQQLGHFYEAGLDNLFVTSREPGAAEPSGRFTLFDSDLDRLPLAPYSLVTFSVDMGLEDSRALEVLSGAFSAAGESDALALGLRLNDVSLWLAPDVARGQIPPLRLKGEVPLGLAPLLDSHDSLAVAGVAADVDGDGRDEALWLMPLWRNDDAPDEPEALHPGAPGAYATCALVIYRINYAAGALQGSAQLLQQLELGEPCPEPVLAAGKLRVGAGPDLVLLTGDARLGPRKPRLLFNDGTGRFSLEDSTFVAVPAERDVRGLSLFRGDDLRIAYVTREGLYVARTKSDGRVYDAVDRLAAFRDARSVVVTDVNGDTFTDVVVADADGLWLTKVALE